MADNSTDVLVNEDRGIRYLQSLLQENITLKQEKLERNRHVLDILHQTQMNPLVINLNLMYLISTWYSELVQERIRWMTLLENERRNTTQLEHQLEAERRKSHDLQHQASILYNNIKQAIRRRRPTK